jgi:HK97 gp10 family phage protein
MARSVGGRILKKALYKSATVIRDDAIRRAPEDTGRLKQFIGRSGGRVKTGDDRFQATVLVGLIRLTKAQQRKTGLTQDAYYGKFVEFGTRFQRAEPFLRPAFDSQKENFIDAFGEELWTLITTALETKSAPSEGA